MCQKGSSYKNIYLTRTLLQCKISSFKINKRFMSVAFVTTSFCIVFATHFMFIGITLSCYDIVSKSFRTESLKKYTFTTKNTHWEATPRVMAAKLTRLTHKIAIHLHLVAESCTICSSRSRQPVLKLLDTLSYVGPQLLFRFLTIV
jgi:hypothetical protein